MRSLAQDTHRDPGRRRAISLTVAFVALASIVAIEALHDHACTGDGCVLCMAAVGAHVALALCAGIVLALPLLQVIEDLRRPRTMSLIRQSLRDRATIAAERVRAAQTPITLKVILLI